VFGFVGSLIKQVFLAVDGPAYTECCVRLCTYLSATLAFVS